MNEHTLTTLRDLQVAIAVLREIDLADCGDTAHQIQTAADELDCLVDDLFDTLADRRAFA